MFDSFNRSLWKAGDSRVKENTELDEFQDEVLDQ